MLGLEGGLTFLYRKGQVNLAFFNSLPCYSEYMLIKMCPQTCRIIHTGLTETDRIETIDFMLQLSQGAEEPLYFEDQPDNLVVDCSKAPKIWDMLYGMRQAALKGEITVVSVEYIAEPERPRA
jgi:hypothetical protein